LPPKVIAGNIGETNRQRIERGAGFDARYLAGNCLRGDFSVFQDMKFREFVARSHQQEWSAPAPGQELRECFSSWATKLTSLGASIEDVFSHWPSEARMGFPYGIEDGDLVFAATVHKGRKESDRGDLKSDDLERPFINLSSTACLCSPRIRLKRGHAKYTNQ
jgi:hypothetical protein